MASELSSDPLTADERNNIMARPRPRQLPIVPAANPGKRKLPLADEARAVDRQARPVYAVWEITLKCDLACRHCGSRAGAARPDELTTAECLDLVDQMADLGVKEVTLIGGEAYLRDDWIDVIRAIRKRGMQVTTTTGGRGVTPEKAKAAAEAGLMAASVSLDGAPATHDRLRGLQGSHAAALEALRNFREAGIDIFVNSQINRLSAPELPDILDCMVETGATAWQLAITVPMGRAVEEPEVLLQPYDLLDVFPLLDRLKKRCEEAGIRMCPGNNVGYFGPHEASLRRYVPGGHSHGCSAGRGTLGIEADGAIKGCPSLPTEAWTGGNIRDASLQDIWERAEALRYTRDRTAKDLWGYCATCYYADECRAGCTWTSFVVFGKPGNNPYCHHRALEMQKDGKRERVIPAEPAPGQPFDHGRFELVIEPWPKSSTAPEDPSKG